MQINPTSNRKLLFQGFLDEQKYKWLFFQEHNFEPQNTAFFLTSYDLYFFSSYLVHYVQFYFTLFKMVQKGESFALNTPIRRVDQGTTNLGPVYNVPTTDKS